VEKASIQMHVISTGNKFQYFHFLQPNQYVVLERKSRFSNIPHQRA
jgi:hypothetical protein